MAYGSSRSQFSSAVALLAAGICFSNFFSSTANAEKAEKKQVDSLACINLCLRAGTLDYSERKQFQTCVGQKLCPVEPKAVPVNQPNDEGYIKRIRNWIAEGLERVWG